MSKKIEIPYKYFIEKEQFSDKLEEWEKVRFIMPDGEDIVIDICNSNPEDYYPEDRNIYRYPNNVDDGVLYDLGDETYDYRGIICVYDEDKIRTRRALVRAYHNEENYEEGVVEISQTNLEAK